MKSFTNSSLRVISVSQREPQRGIDVMKIFAAFRARWHYILVLVPVFTDTIENGHLPRQPREFVTEVVLGILIAVGVYIVYRDIERFRTVAETDALTGLNNRRRFMNDIHREIKLSRRLGAPLSLVYVDVNDFKAINDTHGHGEGDAVLREIGDWLHETARRGNDFCYRLGGDEFGLLLIGATAAQAETMIERAQSQTLARHPHLNRNRVTLSCGVVELGDVESEEHFLQRADATMYERKRQQRHSNTDKAIHDKDREAAPTRQEVGGNL
jgi:diguanylate cyclase (GGDEF)-like protein